jgi:hypothetical protein
MIRLQVLSILSLTSLTLLMLSLLVKTFSYMAFLWNSLLWSSRNSVIILIKFMSKSQQISLPYFNQLDAPLANLKIVTYLFLSFHTRF